MCDLDCCPPNFDLNQFIDVCSEASDDSELCRPMKRSKIEEKPRVFVHVSQDVPKWAEGMEVIRFSIFRLPQKPTKQIGDLAMHENGSKRRFDGRCWRSLCSVGVCMVRPSFAQMGEKKPTHCAQHRLEGQVDVISRQCVVKGCSTFPVFARPGERSKHCVKHRQKDEVDVVNPQCRFVGCSKQPSCALPGERPIHCAEHREIGEIFVTTKQCASYGCSTTPCFGPPGGKPLHCALHRTQGEVDVVNYQCSVKGCTTQPSYGKPGENPIHCARHHLQGEFDVKSKRCGHPDHDWQPFHERPFASFDIDGERQCFTHYYSRVNKTCRAIRREILCLGSLIASLPAMLGLTHEQFGEHYVGHDFRVSSCKLIRRPDMLWSFPMFAILLEIDEHGHRYYTELEELEHLDVIRRWVLDTYGLKHMFVLRVNPDGKEPMFRKTLTSNSEQVWKPTEHCEGKMTQVCETLVPWVRAGMNGPIPQELVGGHQGVFVEKLYY